MSRPLLAFSKPKPRPEHKIGAAEFHRRVFAKWGSKCFFCGGHATDAMHLLGRGGFLGPKTRWLCPEENGRPGCRPCHDDKKKVFPIALMRQSANAINRYCDSIGKAHWKVRVP
jgi:hypothetical protein